MFSRFLVLTGGAVAKSRSHPTRLAALAYTSSQTAGENLRSPQAAAVDLTSKSLHRAALLARLSGICYYPPDQLPAKLAEEGMKLVVAGGTSFTRWYVADGVLDRKPTGHEAVTSSGMEDRTESQNCAESHHVEPRIERVVLLRGVVWQGQDVDAWKLWQDLMRFWPTAFAKEHTEPPGVLSAHAGVADMAGKLYEALRIPVTEGEALKRPITFGGHSLGGSLALLLLVLFRLRHGVPSDMIKCCTFGSPPVLSHGGQDSGGEDILRVLGLPKGAIQGFVLENDPVPRALLSVDPAFTALKQTRPGAALLWLRHRFLGPGVPLTPTRFLADNVGDIHLIMWSPDAGHSVVPLAPGEMEEQLKMAAKGESRSTLQGMMDHAHGSYSLDLDAAARQLAQRGL